MLLLQLQYLALITAKSHLKKPIRLTLLAQNL